MRAYNKSQQMYQQQLSFNSMAAKQARNAEYRKLQDSINEFAFKNQDVVIQAMEQEGTARARGQAGRSAGKSVQAVQAALGRNQAILAESLLSAQLDTKAALKKIANDKYGADLQAWAQKLIKPEKKPDPFAPIRTPRTKFLKPRKLKKFDFGPKPVAGAQASSMGGWVDAISGAVSSAIGLGNLGSSSKYDFSYNNLSIGKNPLAGGMSIGKTSW